VWTRICNLLGAECKRNLVAVKAIAGKYRMTNKPPPEVASTYVESVLQPYKSFLERNEEKFTAFAPKQDWRDEVLEDVTANFLQQVQGLMDTVRQMDSALQRRSKLRSTSGSGASTMADSDKISLQVYLDVKAYGAELSALGVNISVSKAYSGLLEELKEAEKLVS